jgi:hypothetical protein
LAAERWKRSLRTGDRKLARQIADTLDDAGRMLYLNRRSLLLPKKFTTPKRKPRSLIFSLMSFDLCQAVSLARVPCARLPISG